MDLSSAPPTFPLPPRPRPQDKRRMQLANLLDENGELEIVHGEDIYRLRLTRNGKLILTK